MGFTQINVFVWCRYNVIIMLMTYFIPLFVLAIAYTRVGLKLWGSQIIGEARAGQHENSMRSKRKVSREP